MIAAIVRKELTGLMRDRRFLIIGVCMLAMLLAVYLVSLGQQQRRQAERDAIGETARAQWERQGIKHPHRGAHFGIYVFRPESVLSAVDPGISPFVGQAIWLEPHRRNMARFNPAADAGPSFRLGNPTPSLLLTALFPLLVMALAFEMIFREREQGTLRMLQSMGASNLAILGGKLIAIMVCLVALLVPVFSAIAAGAYAQAGASPSQLARIGLLAAACLTYYAIAAAVGMAVGASCRNLRGGLLTVVVLWALFVLVAPRVGAQMAQSAAPLPPASQFWGSIDRDYRHGLPGDPDLATQVRAFENGLLRKYGVATLDRVPIGVNAARRMFRDAYADKVHAHHFDELWRLYRQQQSLLRWASAVSPAVPLQAMASSVAGTSLAHQRHFEEAAERYRRYVNATIDEWDMNHTQGNVSYESQYATDAVWQGVQPFHYEGPPLSFSMREAAIETALLALWTAAALLALCVAARRLRP